MPPLSFTVDSCRSRIQPPRAGGHSPPARLSGDDLVAGPDEHASRSLARDGAPHQGRAVRSCPNLRTSRPRASTLIMSVSCRFTCLFYRLSATSSFRMCSSVRSMGRKSHSFVTKRRFDSWEPRLRPPRTRHYLLVLPLLTSAALARPMRRLSWPRSTDNRMNQKERDMAAIYPPDCLWLGAPVL